jgi:hypothetical protein
VKPTRTQLVLALLGAVTGVFTVLIGLGMAYTGFVRHWDPALNDWTRDAALGFKGLVVASSGVVAFAYGRVLFTNPSVPAQTAAPSTRSPILVPGDPNFHA